MNDPAVRSIRIGTTLTERFGALLAGPVSTDAGARKDSLELRIGEAQQIYPEIWRHLDEARRELAARGADVAAYDELRARPESRGLGVTGVQHQVELSKLALLAGRIRVTESKSADFNLPGFQVARAACLALMDALPEVDWAALERAEHAEIAAAGPLASNRRKVVYLALGVLPILAIAIVAMKLGGKAEPPPAESERRESMEAAKQAGQLDQIRKLRLELGERCDDKVAEIIRSLYTDVGQATSARMFLDEYRTRCPAP